MSKFQLKVIFKINLNHVSRKHQHNCKANEKKFKAYFLQVFYDSRFAY